MNDIVQRIRSMRCIYPTDASELLADAAAEIERLSLALEQRYRTNHDAAPAAIAVSDEDRTDKAVTSHRRDRPGDTPVTEPMPKEKRAEVCFGLDPDLRVWETHTPPTQPTPGEGSTPREGTSEPAAWAVLDSRGTVCVAYTCREAAEAYCEGTFNRLAPLYRQPQDGVVRLPPLDPNGAPGWNAAIGAVREALAEAGVDWDTE